MTVVEGTKSSELPVNAGVPQGSRLGPLLFLVYTNDLVDNLESKPFIFADDTTLIATANSTFETTSILSREHRRLPQLGGQLLAGCGEPLLLRHDDGDGDQKLVARCE